FVPKPVVELHQITPPHKRQDINGRQDIRDANSVMEAAHLSPVWRRASVGGTGCRTSTRLGVSCCRLFIACGSTRPAILGASPADLGSLRRHRSAHPP